MLRKIPNVLFCFQIQDEDLAQSLGLSTGKYLIKHPAAPEQQQKPKKGVRKSVRDKRSTARPKNSSTNTRDTGNLSDGDADMQTSDLDELMDTREMIEFAITSANPKDIGSDFEPTQMLPSNYLEGQVVKIEEFPSNMPGISDGTSANPKDIGSDFEPTQVLPSNYLEGPVVKIEEFPSNMPGISDGTSAAEDEVFLCYMAQSASELPVISDTADQNLSFKQPSMVTTAPVIQSSTLTFPLTLTVNGSAIDNCSAFQFS